MFPTEIGCWCFIANLTFAYLTKLGLLPAEKCTYIERLQDEDEALEYSKLCLEEKSHISFPDLNNLLNEKPELVVMKVNIYLVIWYLIVNHMT